MEYDTDDSDDLFDSFSIHDSGATRAELHKKFIDETFGSVLSNDYNITQNASTSSERPNPQIFNSTFNETSDPFLLAEISDDEKAVRAKKKVCRKKPTNKKAKRPYKKKTLLQAMEMRDKSDQSSELISDLPELIVEKQDNSKKDLLDWNDLDFSEISKAAIYSQTVSESDQSIFDSDSLH